MPAVLERAVPPPHLHLAATSPWPPYNTHACPAAPSSSPTPMTPESLHSFVPRLHDSPVSSSGWFGPSVPAPDPHHEVRQMSSPSAHHAESAAAQTAYGAYAYDQTYVTPHPSSGQFSPHSQFSQAAEAPLPAPAKVDNTVGSYSPVSQYSRTSEAPQPEFVRHSEEPYTEHKHSTEASASHLQIDTNPPNRPQSSPSTFSPNPQPTGALEYQWAMNPLGISAPSLHEHYYASQTYPSIRHSSPHSSEHTFDLPSDLAAPQPRRMYPPIAPHPMGPRTSAPKRSRDDDDELSEQAKRRKRSDSNSTMAMELGEEDRLLIQLKDEESMPWKDIAARFQSDLGKTYQIPALQMRLKRLRERMRVWTETDVKALRMAHEYWVQSKFDIISQKMLEYGAAEKWTARQCARKWAEIDPGPTPYTTYDHHVPTYAPYTMSPVEAPHFMPYVHIQ